MAQYEFYILDVFTSQRLGGNQLAVVVDALAVPDATMQAVAREFGFSETTFVGAAQQGENDARVRIFTPAAELPFAGHPTLGTACVIAGRGNPRAHRRTVRLEETVGVVPVEVESAGGMSGYGLLSAPVLPGRAERVTSAGQLSKAVSLGENDIGFDDHSAAFVGAGNAFAMVPVRSLDALARAHPDMAHWAHAMEGRDTVGAYLYTRGGDAPDTDFRARLFAPDQGIAEDPATGSAAAAFPGQVAVCERLGDGRHQWRVEQGYEMGRPSQIDVIAQIADGTVTAVQVGGHSVEVARGTITI